MHEEDPKLPGYTPEGKRAGKDSAVASGMPPPAAVDELLATFYHRMPFLEPRLGRIGVGFSRGGLQGWFTVIDLSGGVGREPVLLFPAYGQQAVPTSWQPDAADREALPKDAGQQIGYPITLTFPEGKAVRQVEASLTAAGKDVAVWLVPRLSQPWHTVSVVPRQPLPASSSCTMRVAAQIDGKAWAQTWSFTTAAH
jgi:hypothetical protein